MTSWFTKLRESFQPKPVPAVALGAFGKHPGWDDHLEDLGLETEALLAARKLIYVQGIGGLIESGAWTHGDPDDAAPEFDHLFFWCSQPDFLVGRLWASRDGKGRDRYPMVICAHTTFLAPAQAAERIVPVLEKLHAACLATESAGEVRAALDVAREQLRGQLLTSTAPPPLPSTRRAVAERIGVCPMTDNAVRCWYALNSQLTGYASTKVTDDQRRLGPKTVAFPILSQQIRLPVDPTDIVPCVLFWREFVTMMVGKRVPVLLIHPLGSSWVDLIVGSPTPKQLFCFKASRKAIPPVNEIPYNLPDEIRDRATRELEAFLNESGG